MDGMFPLEVFLFMTVTIHFRAYHQCTVCRYVMGLLFLGRIDIHLFVMGLCVCVFCFVWGLACFLLWPQVLMQWDVIPGHNEVPVTACQPATCLCWHLFWVYPSGTGSKCEERLTIWRQHHTLSHTAENPPLAAFVVEINFTFIKINYNIFVENHLHQFAVTITVQTHL